MITRQDPRAARSLYNQDAVLLASPARLLTMLCDRMILELQRGEAAQAEQDWVRASKHLVHAQAIINELASSLKVDEWDGGPGLFSLYMFAFKRTVDANIGRDIEATREVISLLDPIRQTWHDAADQLSAKSVAEASSRSDGSIGVG
jgi:flagellar secretion chaperone FliS